MNGASVTIDLANIGFHICYRPSSDERHNNMLIPGTKCGFSVMEGNNTIYSVTWSDNKCLTKSTTDTVLLDEKGFKSQRISFLGTQLKALRKRLYANGGLIGDYGSNLIKQHPSGIMQ
jgi:hypothetical protein